MKNKEITEIKTLSAKLHEIEWIAEFDNELNVIFFKINDIFEMSLKNHTLLWEWRQACIFFQKREIHGISSDDYSEAKKGCFSVINSLIKKLEKTD